MVKRLSLALCSWLSSIDRATLEVHQTEMNCCSNLDDKLYNRHDWSFTRTHVIGLISIRVIVVASTSTEPGL